jgi:hypothetical protein
MQTHPVFTDIALQSEDELVQLLGSRIEERATIPAWPLSCVQQVRLANSGRLVYKSQLPPTVEPEFYQAASSALLVDHRLLDTLGDSRTMTIDWIDAPLLSNTAPSVAGIIDRGRLLVAQIGAIGPVSRSGSDARRAASYGAKSAGSSDLRPAVGDPGTHRGASRQARRRRIRGAFPLA